jgi:hypothetical protein
MGLIQVLRDGRWYLDGTKLPSIMKREEFSTGYYEGLPWFLDSMRPSGFLGRAFGNYVSQISELCDDPDRWTDLELLDLLASQKCENMPGNFIIGKETCTEFLWVREQILSNNYGPFTYRDYPELADNALSGEAKVGSSAGGEQPKFAGIVQNPTEEHSKNVLVKFTSPTLDQPAGKRWGDLLIAEHTANAVLRKNGFQTAEIKGLQDIRGRRYLESVRFDRIGPLGRRGMISIGSLDAALVGSSQSNWVEPATALHKEGYISRQDLEAVRDLYSFGQMVANTDMHPGNLSFFLPEQEDEQFSLCPVYDMLPMLYRPNPHGEIIPRNFKMELPKPENQESRERMYPIALEYWETLTRDEKISEEFRQITTQAQHDLQTLHHSQLEGKSFTEMPSKNRQTGILPQTTIKR